MTEPHLNIALLYQDIGALKSQSDERSRQTTELYNLVRDISARMATKEDIQELKVQIAAGEDKADDLHNRVNALENDRKMVKTAVATAIGAPPIIAAIIEVGRFIIGKH